MRSFVFSILALCALPAIAAAQPGADPSAPPPPAGEPMPPPPPPGPPPGPPPPAPMQPQLVPVAPPPPAGFAAHDGVTFEANIGVGFARVSASGNSENSDGALAGLDVGVGGWLTPRLALTGRISGVDVKDDGQTETVVAAFVGPSVQYWIDPHLWVGGGAGFATFRQITNCSSNGNTDQCGYNGFGLDLRAGYSVGTSKHTFNVSVEVTPGFYSIPTVVDSAGDVSNTSATITGFSLLLGYQYL